VNEGKREDERMLSARAPPVPLSVRALESAQIKIGLILNLRELLRKNTANPVLTQSGEPLITIGLLCLIPY